MLHGRGVCRPHGPKQHLSWLILNMGGFFGVVSQRDAVEDIFFGTDYHSHLATYRAGMVVYDRELGFQREIHSIEKDPFRSKFIGVLNSMSGQSGIGCLSNVSPAPLIIVSALGVYAICFTGAINNKEELAAELLSRKGFHFDALAQSGINEVELLAALINQKDTFEQGILYAQDRIEGSCNVLVLTDRSEIYAARDKLGRIPLSVGQNDAGYAFSFEPFVLGKMGYDLVRELGPNELVKASCHELSFLAPAKKEMKICSFLWNYYGYPSSSYEGRNVEVMRYQNGKILAENESDQGLFQEVDYVCGVPDSGVAHAIGYAGASGVNYARCFIKYSPSWSRSFMPAKQETRNRVAKMKQLPIKDLIKDKNLLFVDDSVVRGTQFRETVDFLKENGAKEVHMRSACPPMMYPCKYLNFNGKIKPMELITRRLIVELEGEEGLKYIAEYSDRSTERGEKLRSLMAEKFHFKSVDFQSLEGMVEAIGIDPCCLCTYCWNGEE